MFRSFFNLLRTPVIQPVSLASGDDLVISTPDRLDSDDALSLLNAAKRQFPGVRIHLLCGFGQVQVKRNDGRRNGASGNDCCDPPLPVGNPSGDKPAFGLAAAREEGDVSVITYASGGRIVAVYVPPKQQSDSVADGHGSNPEKRAA